MFYRRFNAILINIIREKHHKIIDYTRVPKIDESDLEEWFVRGSGPGGSNTNKNSNACVLRHIPSGIIYKCHETRNLHENRKRARLHLVKKLDNLLNRELSIDSQIKENLRKKSLKREQKQEKLRSLKEEWKNRENPT